MYKNKLEGFPEEIVNKMMERQVEQGNPADHTVFENRLSVDKDLKGFTWSKTTEGRSFWDQVISDKRFEVFFEKYPKSRAYGGRLTGFPKEVVEKMLERQDEQGNPQKVSVFEEDPTNGKRHGGFTWSDTREGGGFWAGIIVSKKFDLFFEKYPKQEQTPIYTRQYCEKNKIAIQCATAEEMVAVCKIMGIEDLSSHFPVYKTNTCLFGDYRGSYGDISYAEKDDHTIIQAHTIIKQQPKTMKTIIGYTCPISMFSGAIPAGTTYQKSGSPVGKGTYCPNLPIGDTRYNLPSELVETWTPVYEQEAEILVVGSKSVKVIVKNGIASSRGGTYDLVKLQEYVDYHDSTNAYKHLGPYVISVPDNLHCHRIGCEDENNLFSLNELKKVLQIANKQK